MAKKSTKDIAEMSDDDLLKEWTALSKQVEQDRERLRAFSEEHQHRTTQTNLADRFEGMSAHEARALLEFAQNAEAAAIESEESVHNG